MLRFPVWFRVDACRAWKSVNCGSALAVTLVGGADRVSSDIIVDARDDINAVFYIEMK
jgi:hypothetical protein